MSGAKTAAPLHDDDGNVTDYKNLKYSWNAENQMISAEPKNPAEGDTKTEYLYDYMGRRVRKQVFSRNAGNSGWNATPDTEKLFVCDGWNLIKEITKVGGTPSDKYYVWGLDLSQSLQGAGGIGGLVCAVHGGEVRHFFYDANGNVGQVVNETGTIIARYEYDPFGNALVADGAYAQENPFRFSTKYYDAETGLYYYGFRYYSAELGRWWSRDPIGEEGGYNLYTFVMNNSLVFIDILGMSGVDTDPAIERFNAWWKSEPGKRKIGLPQKKAMWDKNISHYSVPFTADLILELQRIESKGYSVKCLSDELIDVIYWDVFYRKIWDITGLSFSFWFFPPNELFRKIPNYNSSLGFSKNIEGITEEQAKKLRELLENIPGVKKVYAFGSRTKGTSTTESDLDIILIGDVIYSDPITQRAV